MWILVNYYTFLGITLDNKLIIHYILFCYVLNYRKLYIFKKIILSQFKKPNFII